MDYRRFARRCRIAAAVVALPMTALAQEEAGISAKRREVQGVMDACSAEITRRYRDGEADVDTLLGEQPTSRA